MGDPTDLQPEEHSPDTRIESANINCQSPALSSNDAAFSQDADLEEQDVDSNGSTTTSSMVAVGQSSLSYGFVGKSLYTHPIKNGSILGVCHNSRARLFLLLDANGITSWKHESTIGPQVERQVNYPNYQYRLYSNLIYAKKHNVYFCLGKDFSLKILNAQFQETYTVDANLRNVMFLLYNPDREELITGGVGGSKIWKFVQVVEQQGWKEVKAMSNFKLQHVYTLSNVGGGWVKRVTLNFKLSHLYCCSESDLYAYNLNTGKELFCINGAHDMSITGCIFSPYAGLMISSSFDSTVKCWVINGGLVNTFRCHSKGVTQILLHPSTSRYIVSCSMDCTVKILCLETMTVVYSLTAASEGIEWMGLLPDNSLYTCSSRQLSIWNLNYFVEFFGLSRSDVLQFWRCDAEKKAPRLMALNNDNCVRIFCQKTGVHLSSVLPMPCLTPLQNVKAVCYCRELNLVYCLLSDSRLWIYTTRTDPSCRIAQWNLIKIQDALITNQELDDQESANSSILKRASPYRAVGDIHTNVEICSCTAITILNSNVILYGDEGWCGTVPKLFLLLGLEDGRVLFMDPFVRGLLHVDFRANKDKITGLKHDRINRQLITQCVRNQVSVFQVWSLPSLSLQHELCVYIDNVSFSRLGDLIMFGYDDAAVSFHTLYDIDEDNIYRKTNQIKNTEELKSNGTVVKRYEHRSAIINTDCNEHRSLFLSCSRDCCVKVWSFDQNIIAEFNLDQSLTCAYFLNPNADLVLGFCKNIYTISYNQVLKGMIGYEEDKDDTSSLYAQSDVYEDPTVTQEGIIPNLDPMTLRTYLKPYELDITQDFLEATDIVVKPEAAAEKADSDIFSNADTDIYQSDISLTPRLVDVEIQSVQSLDLDEISLHGGNSPEPKGGTLQAKLESLDVTHPRHADELRPIFGESPGGTPTVSSAASIADSRSDLEDFSDFEFGTDYDSNEDDAGAGGRKRKSLRYNQVELEQRKIMGKTHLLKLNIPADEIVEKESPKTPAQARYGLERMKVDVSALLKEKPTKSVRISAGGTSGQSATTRNVLEEADSIALRKSLQAGASELASKKAASRASKKKQAPAARKKAPIGSKKQKETKLVTEKIKEEITEIVEPEVETEKKIEKIKYIGGDLSSGLIPSAAPPPTQKKKEARKGTLINVQAKDTEGKLSYPDEMVKMPLDSPEIEESEAGTHAEDVDLSAFIDNDDDEMDCRSAASWNPKFDFERPVSSSGKKRDAQTPTSTKTSLGGFETPDMASASKIRVNVRQRTPAAMSDLTMDLDAFSTRIDEFDEDLEDQMSPIQSMAGSHAAALSITAKVHLPGLEDNGLDNIPAQSDALSQWLMLSVPRAVSEASTVRPGTQQSSIHVEPRTPFMSKFVESKLKREADRKSAASKKRINAKLGETTPEIGNNETKLSKSPMLGYRTQQRPHTAPMRFSYQDLQDAFEDALLKYQGDMDINKLYRKNNSEFTGDWQEKMIERHKLLAMQKEIRARSAVYKRRILHQEQVEKRHALLGHRHCDGLILPTVDALTTVPSRANTATYSRPPTVAQPVRSVSVMDRNVNNNELTESSSARQEQLLEKVSRIQSSHVNYRYRINESLCEQLHNTLQSSDSETSSNKEVQFNTADSVQYMNPRQTPIIDNLQRSQSIPTRCSKYILVKSKKNNGRNVSPTPLEQNLLSNRFPQQAMKIFNQQTSSQFKMTSSNTNSSRSGQNNSVSSSAKTVRASFK